MALAHFTERLDFFVDGLINVSAMQKAVRDFLAAHADQDQPADEIIRDLARRISGVEHDFLGATLGEVTGALEAFAASQPGNARRAKSGNLVAP